MRAPGRRAAIQRLHQRLFAGVIPREGERARLVARERRVVFARQQGARQKNVPTTVKQDVCIDIIVDRRKNTKSVMCERVARISLVFRKYSFRFAWRSAEAQN